MLLARFSVCFGAFVFATVLFGDPKIPSHLSPNPKERAAAGRGCTLLELTKNCAYYNPDDPTNPFKDQLYITLEDGSRIPNPYAVERYREKKRKDPNRPDLDKQYQEELRSQYAKKLGALGGMDYVLNLAEGRGKFNEGFRDNLKDVLTPYSPLNASLPDDELVWLTVPPFRQKDGGPAKVTSMTALEARTLLDSTIGEGRRLSLEKKWHDTYVQSSWLAFMQNNPRAWEENTLFKKEDDAQEAEDKKKEGHVADLYRNFVLPEMAKLVTGGKFQTEWTEDEKNMVEQLYSVKVALGSSVLAKQTPQCQGPDHSPVFLPNQNTIVFCHQMNGLPDANIVSTMAHELAHRIGPCLARFPTYSVNFPELDKASRAFKAMKADDRHAAPDWKIFEYIVGQANQGIDTSLAPLQALYAKEDFDEAMRKNWITIKNPAVSEKGSPLKAISDCLQTPVGGGFVAQASSRPTFVDQAAKARESLYGDDRNESRKKLTAATNAYDECFDYTASNMKEIVPDWVAAQLSGTFVKKMGKPLVTVAEKLSPIAYLAGMACQQYLKKQSLDQPPANAITVASEDQLRAKGFHPNELDRLDLVALANTEIQTAEGCKPIVPQPCVMH